MPQVCEDLDAGEAEARRPSRVRRRQIPLNRALRRSMPDLSAAEAAVSLMPLSSVPLRHRLNRVTGIVSSCSVNSSPGSNDTPPPVQTAVEAVDDVAIERPVRLAGATSFFCGSSHGLEYEIRSELVCPRWSRQPP